MEKELEFNHNYIELMRLRLARHVKVEVDMPRGLCRGYQIAPLLFITLIENAFKHGTSATEPSFVTIVMREPSPGVIECRIENSCFPKTRTTKAARASGSKTSRDSSNCSIPASTRCMPRAMHGSTARRSPST